MQEKDLAQTQGSVVEVKVKGSNPIRDSFLFGLKNRMLQFVALYAPGFKTVRVWLHRMRGVVIGDNVSIGLSVLIETAYPRLVFVGNNVTIGMRTIVIGHLRDLTSEARSGDEHTVRIEENVYIGPGVIILPNVTIGHGAVVSAGSVVSRSVPPETLVRGNPAEPIAHCGVSLGGGVSYEQFVSHLTQGISAVLADLIGNHVRLPEGNPHDASRASETLILPPELGNSFTCSSLIWSRRM
jgi:acetyltransferase-like isoleucine patch superfamily enzyme